MKKIIIIVFLVLFSITLTSCDRKRGVYYLNFKPEADKAWNTLAQKYQEEFGVNVNVVTASEGRYEETLTTEMNKSSAPTLFQINGLIAYETWKDYAYDLKDTKLYSELISDDYAIISDGGVYGISYVYEGYGLITNKTLLKEAGFEYEEVNSLKKLKEVAKSITNNKSQLGFGAFTSSGLDGSSSWRFSGHLLNVPLFYELEKNNINNQPSEIKGEYLDKYKEVWDMYINNTYNTTSTTLTNITMDAARGEFLNKKAVFYQNGTWEYSNIKTVFKDEEIGFLPIYLGIDDENQGLCSGTENYWVVNKESSKEDIEETIKFLEWVVTSEEGLKALAYDMGYMTPFKGALSTNNILYDYIEKANEEGKVNINWKFTLTPNPEVFRSRLVDSLAIYSANPSLEKWINVNKSVVDGWREQYQASHQK